MYKIFYGTLKIKYRVNLRDIQFRTIKRVNVHKSLNFVHIRLHNRKIQNRNTEERGE